MASTGDPTPPSPTVQESHEIIIALMGVTGTGKTSFINKAAKSSLRVGGGLQPETKKVQEAAFRLDGRNVVLLDSPGFDDTTHTDIEILEIIGDYLREGSKKQKYLTGLIYMQRITDNRVAGSARKCLRILRNLCSDENLGHLVLVTSQWDIVAKDEGEKREEELRNTEEFWAEMIRHGAIIDRHSNTEESAVKILRRFLPKSTTILKFQKEFEKHGIIGDTAAGQEIIALLSKELTRYEEQIQRLRDEKVKIEEDVKTLREDMEDLRRDNEKREREREEEREREREIRADLSLKVQIIENSAREKEEMAAKMRSLRGDMEKLKLDREKLINEDLRPKEERLKLAEGEVQDLKREVEELQREKSRQATEKSKIEENEADSKTKDHAANEDQEQEVKKAEKIAKENEIGLLRTGIEKLKRDVEDGAERETAMKSELESDEQAVQRLDLAEREANQKSKLLGVELAALDRKKRHGRDLEEQSRRERSRIFKGKREKEDDIDRIENEMNALEQKKKRANNEISTLKEPAASRRAGGRSHLGCIQQ